MYLLRRTAVRAITSTPSKTLFVKPRSITTYTFAFRARQQQWTVPALQRRFVSEEATQTETVDKDSVQPVPEETKTETVGEGFAQTAPEAPVENGLAPAQEAVREPPTNSSATAGIDTLEAIAAGASGGQAQSQPSTTRLGGPPAPNNTVYVGNLYYEVGEDQLKRIFSRFGAVDSVKIVYDNRGLSRGFGYIEYQNVNDAQSAVDNLDMQVFEGRNLVVQFHRPRVSARSNRDSKSNLIPNPPSKTLFIGNMSFEMSDKDLNDLFRDVRNVLDVRVAIDRRTGQPRGFAHADFLDIASATSAMGMLQEKVIHGRKLRIDFSKPGTQMRREGREQRDTIQA